MEREGEKGERERERERERVRERERERESEREREYKHYTCSVGIICHKVPNPPAAKLTTGSLPSSAVFFKSSCDTPSSLA